MKTFLCLFTLAGLLAFTTTGCVEEHGHGGYYGHDDYGHGYYHHDWGHDRDGHWGHYDDD